MLTELQRARLAKKLERLAETETRPEHKAKLEVAAKNLKALNRSSLVQQEHEARASDTQDTP